MQSPRDFPTRTPPSNQVGEPSYFRKWALRAANRSSSEEVAPHNIAASPDTTPSHRRADTTGGRTVRSSPLLTPPARPPLISRGSYRGRSSTFDVQLEESPSSSIACISTETLASYETRSSVGPAKSSSRNRTLKALPDRQRRLSTPTDDHHTRGTTKGRRWKREISSHLIELRVTRKAPQESTSTLDLSGPTLVNKNQADIRSGYKEPESAGFALEGTGAETASLSSREKEEPLRSLDDGYAEGLYCRVRRRLGLKKGPVLEPDGKRSPSQKDAETERVLNHAAELLRSEPVHKSNLSGLSTSTSKLSIAAIHHRKGGQFSTTSSLRNLFMGREPMPSPDSAALYTGSDNEQYFRVELSSPEAPNFLPSEAQRVGTPPLPGGGGRKRPLRGFFFDFRPPEEQSDAESPSWEASSASGKSSKTSRRQSDESDEGKERGWFRVRVKTFSDRNISEFDVPEHLPNSPLCARNPKHSSGGKGICPYHGRARTDSTQASDSTEKADANEEK
ncbi:accessory factor associated with RNA polymerase II [Xylographa vitiligo]|nr:accessory factor associated with RNA polymerase II [Xylographa vitiligo]